MNSKQFMKRVSILIAGIAFYVACAPVQHTRDAPNTSDFTPTANITEAKTSTPADPRHERVVAPTPSAVVETKQGRVVRLVDHGISAYKGLRYHGPKQGNYASTGT
jgi:hypothetical protein